jgi:hypothetical protein
LKTPGRRAALNRIEAEPATLVTTYCAGGETGGERAGTKLIFPSDEDGQKNFIFFRSVMAQQIASDIGRLG